LNSDVDRALVFAKLKHGNQMYGDHPYIYHLTKVVYLCEKLGLPVQCQIIGALHDIYEDTDVTVDEVEEAFGKFVSDTVMCLTRNKKEDYFVYLKDVSRHPIARAVKICDLLTNLEHAISDNRYYYLIDRYQKALYFLGTNV
jgi:(p)ppGpp synthase/HD superfamily hydrolase